INAQVNADGTASGSYDVAVISAGMAGLGFSSAGGETSSQSNSKSLTVNANPSLTLEVRSEGDIVDANHMCAWIDPATPSMPMLTAKIIGGTSAATATWQIKTSFEWITRNPNK